MNPLQWYRRRRLWRDYIALLDHASAARLARIIAPSRSARDRRLALALAERARDTATDPGVRRSMQMYADALAAGRRIKTTTFPVEFRFVHVDPELAEAVEEALTQGDT
jgi:hypothetical protein